jgi:hypothetical protein
MKNHERVAKMPDKRYRIQHRFWLDGTKPREDELSIRLDGLRQNREFASFMRDAAMLLFSLRDGDLSVFAEMFPEAVSVIKQQGAAEERHNYQREFEGKLEELKALISSIKAIKPSSESSNPRPLLGGPKPLAAPKLAPPKYDDEDEALIAIRNDTSTESAMNFLKSAFALQQ